MNLFKSKKENFLKGIKKNLLFAKNFIKESVTKIVEIISKNLIK